MDAPHDDDDNSSTQPPTATDTTADVDDAVAMVPRGADADAASSSSSSSDHTEYLARDFDSMGLSNDLLRGIYAYGLEKPSALQQRAIVPLVQGRDVITVAASGTGSTTTLVIGLVQWVDPNQNGLQALVLAPTRELAMIVGRVVECFGKFMDVRVQVLSTGQSPTAVLQGDPHVVVSTPGRALGWLKAMRDTGARQGIRTWSLVELDEMQSRGCGVHIQGIAKLLPANVQVAIEVGPTLPPETSALAFKLTRDAVTINLPSNTLSLDRVRQFKIDCEREEWKLETLQDIFASINITQALIYCNTARKVDWLAEQMARDGWASVVVRFHNAMDSDERQRAVDDLLTGTARVMVATDAFSLRDRGPAQMPVINYDLPHQRESYLHRAGRTGRHGGGTVVSLVTREDAKAVRDIELFYATCIDDMPADVSSI